MTKFKTKKILALAVLATLILAGIYLYNHRVDNLPGTIVGANPKNIPESGLPECELNGPDFKQLPCYKPPGAYYK